jgi:hypothetical protein
MTPKAIWHLYSTGTANALVTVLTDANRFSIRVIITPHDASSSGALTHDERQIEQDG